MARPESQMRNWAGTLEKGCAKLVFETQSTRSMFKSLGFVQHRRSRIMNHLLLPLSFYRCFKTGTVKLNTAELSGDA